MFALFAAKLICGNSCNSRQKNYVSFVVKNPRPSVSTRRARARRGRSVVKNDLCLCAFLRQNKFVLIRAIRVAISLGVEAKHT